MHNYSDRTFFIFLILLILTISFILNLPAIILFEIIGLINLKELADFGQFFGGVIGTIISFATLYFLLENLELFRKQTEDVEKQVEIMNKSSIIDAMFKYQENPNNKVKEQEIKLAKSIIEEQTESIMKYSQYKHFEIPKLVPGHSDDPIIKVIKSNVQENSEIILLFDTNTITKKLISIYNNLSYEIYKIDTDDPIFIKYALVVPKNPSDFNLILNIKSEFTGRIWFQKISRINGVIIVGHLEENVA